MRKNPIKILVDYCLFTAPIYIVKPSVIEPRPFSVKGFYLAELITNPTEVLFLPHPEDLHAQFNSKTVFADKQNTVE